MIQRGMGHQLWVRFCLVDLQVSMCTVADALIPRLCSRDVNIAVPPQHLQGISVRGWNERISGKSEFKWESSQKSYASGSQRMQSHHKMSEKFVTIGSPFLIVRVLLAMLQKEFMIMFIYLFFITFISVHVLSACLSVPHMCKLPREARRGCRMPWTWSYRLWTVMGGVGC